MKLFTSREGRGIVYFLLLAVLVVIGIFLAQRRESTFVAEHTERELEAAEAPDSLFAFDPNTVEYADLKRLGLPTRLAVNLLNWRSSGKVFRIPEDVAACYGMTDSIYFVLAPHIEIDPKFSTRPAFRSGGRDYTSYSSRPRRRITPREPFRIDTVSAPYIASLGFSVRQAEAIVRYRDLSGIYDEADLRACYMIADSVADLLLPYVVFPAPKAPKGPIEINGADSATLLGITGIGPKSLTAILSYRKRLGGFHRIGQLAEIPQVTEANYERIVKQIYCDSCKIQKIDVNFASQSTLKGHPYLPPAVLRKLLSKRQLKGGWSSVEEMIEENILTREEAERLAPYLRFNE